jgi:hypothetical protein
MKSLLCLALFLVCFAGLTSVAQAQVANFEAKCTWNSTNTAFTCNFDSTRPSWNPTSCSGGLAPMYRWTFGDGSPTDPSGGGFGFTSKPNHTYSAPPAGTYGYVVKLEIQCYPDSGSTVSASKERFICVFGLGSPGCIQVNGTYN